jgi:hypothetical protein
MAAGLAWFAQYRNAMKVRINEELMVLAAQGFPVTLEQLNNWYWVPDGAENAADVYLEAFTHLKEWKPDLLAKMPVSGPVSTDPNGAVDAPVVELMEKYVEDHTQALALLKQAANLEYCRYPVDFRTGHKMQLAWLPEIRSSERVLCVQMQLAIEKGMVSEFMDAFDVSSALIQSLAQEPMQVSQLIRVTCLSMSMTVLEQALGRLRFTEEQLADLSDTLARHQDTQAWVRGTAGVVCEQVNRFRNAEATMESMQSEDFDAPGWASKLYWTLGWADRDVLEYIDVAQSALGADWQSSQDLLNISRTLKAKAKAISNTHLLANIGTSGWDQVFDLYVQHMVHLDCAQTVLAVKRYELAHGALPETLEALVPQFLDAVPIDPFNGMPIRFKSKDSQFVIYSVGEDGQDNLGLPADTQNQDKPHDLSFTVKQMPPQDPDLLRLTI